MDRRKFLQIAGKEEIKVFQRHISFFVGESFVLFAVLMTAFSIWQYTRVLKTLHPTDIPAGYSLSAGIVVNSIVGLLGIVLSTYIARGFI